MARPDDEYQDYQERPLYWDKRNKRQKTRAEEETGRAEPTMPRAASRLVWGCGCALIVVALVVGGAIAGWRRLPPFAVLGLHWIVDTTIDGNLTVNNVRANIPDAWRPPVEATVDAYGDAYEEGLVAGRHMFETYMLALNAVQPGAQQDEALRAFVQHMRGGLLPGAAEALPPLPVADAGAHEEPLASAPPWNGFALLPPAERARQHEKRDRLAGALSRVYGPTSRARILPEGAVVHDFGPGALPATVLDSWDATSPAGGGMAFRRGTIGFSDTVSQAIVIAPGARDARAALEFTTTAGTVDFWYYFDGGVDVGSTFTVEVDGTPVFTDALPSTPPGNIATAWRQAHLADLGAGDATRIAVLVTVTGCAAECTVYVDDVVFGP